MDELLPDLAPFLGLRCHVLVVHHLPGRIRLKLSPAALRDLPSVDPMPFLDLLDGLPVRITRFNAMALSVVVEYDPQVIGAADWHMILNGDMGQITSILNRHFGGGVSPDASRRSVS